MDAITFFLSFLALLVSITTAINDHFRNWQINRTNLEATYFDEIYKDHLIYDIPKARRHMRFNPENKLVDTEKFIDELNAVRKDSLYFCYTDAHFYHSVVSKLQKLEDYIINLEDTVFSQEEQTAFAEEVQIQLNAIYSCITDRYNGLSHT